MAPGRRSDGGSAGRGWRTGCHRSPEGGGARRDQPYAQDPSTSDRGGPAGQDRPAATSRSAALLLDLGSDLLQLRHDLSAECRDATFDDALDLREGGKLLGDLSRDLAWE